MSQNPNQGNSDDEQLIFLVVSTIICGLLYVGYLYLQEEISAMAGAIAWLHIKPIAMLINLIPATLELPWIGNFLFGKVATANKFLEQGNFAYMTPQDRRYVLAAAGLCALPIYLPFMLYVGMAGRKFRPDVIYKTAYSLDQMIWTQSEHWLTSRNARHINPLKIPEVSAGFLARGVVEKTAKRKTKHKNIGEMIRLAPEIIAPAAWHRAMRPEEWLVANGLCMDHQQINSAISKNWKYPDRLLESRDKWHDLTLETLMEALAGQLKTEWHGFSTLRPCHKALCAVMCLFYNYNITEGNILLNDLGGINDSIRGKPGGMDAAITAENNFLDRINKILNGQPGTQMREIADKHAWLESAFPAMLTHARKDRGVLPAAAFLWIKAEDRRLWYILDNVGSEAVMIESAGAMAHFRAEHQIGTPIYRPAVYQAARALLEDYLDMTPERIIARHDKKERGKTAGERITALLHQNAEQQKNNSTTGIVLEKPEKISN